MGEDKSYRKFAESRLEARREVLRNAPFFSCACCQKQKPKGEAAGVHLYEPNSELRKHMLDGKGTLKVATYVLCLECLDSVPEQIINTKVTAYLGKQGLFGAVPGV
jgi:hypothetical protein